MSMTHTHKRKVVRYRNKLRHDQLRNDATKWCPHRTWQGTPPRRTQNELIQTGPLEERKSWTASPRISLSVTYLFCSHCFLQTYGAPSHIYGLSQWSHSPRRLMNRCISPWSTSTIIEIIYSIWMISFSRQSSSVSYRRSFENEALHWMNECLYKCSASEAAPRASDEERSAADAGLELPTRSHDQGLLQGRHSTVPGYTFNNTPKKAASHAIILLAHAS